MREVAALVFHTSIAFPHIGVVARDLDKGLKGLSGDLLNVPIRIASARHRQPGSERLATGASVPPL